ncbi:HD domain-containing protein [Pseudovibrio ascidiaceicola]|uniref:HD domain-containing protein n=1 Tax=Pseudovibrio ascidiaceicola TaxID=285279 RepID=UPI00135AF848|nr:ATP-binding protein [Pseudovibrio ascidiaceicola]
MSSLSTVETKAKAATSLHAFPVNIEDIRRSVTDILSQFGSNLIFREYTTHDITHIDDMLTTAEWIIPDKTKAVMTKGDWLMLVLSIYFHDMGLVVTESEFENRSKTGFLKFCNDVLFQGEAGADYRAKVEAMKQEEQERFLYQEFVRHNHATRVKVWINGDDSEELGYCKSQIELVSKLLSPLTKEFRRDLGLVCESHNLDDIEDTKKYRVNQPYGNDDDAEVNLQYISALLRTIDLIQITNRRAPSALYKLIDPKDPISQLEWAKQNAVTRVRKQAKTDDEGAVDDDLQSDTIEVFAQFESEASFFGLNSYLRYANEQVRATYQILEKTKKLSAKNYDFPWKRVDDTNVTAEGFEEEPFGFEIDQEKILDLLTGHTLYNDSRVVVRELVQNAIDAVRLQFHNKGKGSELEGKVQIKWNSKNNELTIVDNGTGMTQEVIENHLLKVGSSRYQNPKFKENFPDFTSISRFGIGVLTAFMVADQVEIATVNPDEEKARKISLRSVHGKYLIKLLDKSSKEVSESIGAHGTKIVIRMRASARDLDIRETLETYVLFPRCNVSLSVDDDSPIPVGFKSPKDAIEEYLKRDTTTWRFGEEKITVHEATEDGITVAYAMAYSAHYKDWQFIRLPEYSRRNQNIEQNPIKTCVEGIVVHDGLLGGVDHRLLAVINMVGKNAPRTNVARSALETTDEFDNAVSRVNRLLLKAVETERNRLVEDEGYSITWAVEQMPYLLTPIIGNRKERNTENELKLQHNELCNIKMFIGEEDCHRKPLSAKDLIEREEFWTVDSLLFSSTEHFIREAKQEIARSNILQYVYGEDESTRKNMLVVSDISVANVRSTVISKIFQASYFKANEQERSLDVKWIKTDSNWTSSSEILSAIYQTESYQDYDALVQFRDEIFRSGLRKEAKELYIPLNSNEIIVENLERFNSVTTQGMTFALPSHPLSKYFTKRPENWESDHAYLRVTAIMFSITLALGDRIGLETDEVWNFVRRSLSNYLLDALGEDMRTLELELTKMGTLNCYNPFSWRQRTID